MSDLPTSRGERQPFFFGLFRHVRGSRAMIGVLGLYQVMTAYG